MARYGCTTSKLSKRSGDTPTQHTNVKLRIIAARSSARENLTARLSLASPKLTGGPTHCPHRMRPDPLNANGS